MVKVHDEDIMAEPRQAPTATTSSGASGSSNRHSQFRNGKSHNTNNTSINNSNNHLHHSPHQHFHHYHWSYPASNLASSSTLSTIPGGSPSSTGNGSPVAVAAVAAAGGVATFHFGPGFEPQQQITRYPSGGNTGASTSNASAPSQQHVVHFHVNPGVTVSFQMGDNVQVIKGKL